VVLDLSKSFSSSSAVQLIHCSNFGVTFLGSRVYFLKIWVVVTLIFEIWVTMTQFFENRGALLTQKFDPKILIVYKRVPRFEFSLLCSWCEQESIVEKVLWVHCAAG